MGFWDNRDIAEGMEARYIRNGAPPWIRNFVAQGSANGTAMEHFLIHFYECVSNYKPSGADLIVFETLTEVKTTSINKDGLGKWQHIEPAHPWEVLLLVRVEYQSIEVYLMCRKEFERAQTNGDVKVQGKLGVSYEGWWFSPYTKAIPYSTHVISIKGPEPGPKAGEGDCKPFKELIDKCTNSD
jgi:hypothetical protein